MRRDDHPYLGSEYLTRSVGNYCLMCGARMGNIGRKGWNFLHYKPMNGKRILIGYVHDWDCWQDSDDQDDDKARV
jgi:hypothetical protein